MRKFIFGLIIGLFLSLGITSFAAVELKVIPNPFPIFIDGIKTELDGFNINGLTYLQLSGLKKAGLTVSFDSNKKQIDIITPSAAPSTAAPNDQPNIAEGDNNMSIEYDPVTGLPIGAVYIDNEKDGKAYKTIQYNDKIYISSNDLKRIFNAVPGYVDPKQGTIIYTKEDINITVNIGPSADIFFANHYTYYNIEDVLSLLK